MAVPKEWKGNTPLTADILTAEIKTPFDELYKRGSVFNVMHSIPDWPGGYGGFTTSFITLEPPEIFTITIDQKVANKNWLIMYKADLMVGATSAFITLDIWDNTDSVYLSGVAGGILGFHATVTNSLLPVSGFLNYSFANVGEHELQMHAKISSGWGYIGIGGAYALFGAMESF